MLFVATLAGVALFHRHVLPIALTGLATIAAYKTAVGGFKYGDGLTGFVAHLGHEWILIANLLMLLTGFALLARYFELSKVPEKLPHYLPDGWGGGVALLAMIFVMSAFLDNIAAAIIGGTIARSVFRQKVHIGYLAAIVAASNAGGAGSVVGDTTTTMMWISGVSPLEVAKAFVASTAAFIVFAIPAARQQHAWQAIAKDEPVGLKVDRVSLGIAIAILLAAIVANAGLNLTAPQVLEHIPAVGLAVWATILLANVVRRADWGVVPDAAKGAVFLLALVLSASMMPLEALPKAATETTFGLGFLSAVFDNIPLTALAIKQGGYDWGFLAFAVGFGGSMLWFGSSAGVALSSTFPEARSAIAWVKAGWHVPLAYVVGFAVMALLTPWHPT